MATVEDKRNHPRAHLRHIEHEVCKILGKPVYDATVTKMVQLIMRQRIKEVVHCYNHFPFGYAEQRVQEWQETLKEYRKTFPNG